MDLGGVQGTHVPDVRPNLNSNCNIFRPKGTPSPSLLKKFLDPPVHIHN